MEDRSGNVSIELNQLSQLFAQAPAAIAVLTGVDHIFTLVNPLFCKLCDRPSEELIGKSVREIFSESGSGGLLNFFDEVYDTGQAIVEHGIPLKLSANKTRYYNFAIQPIKDELDRVVDLMVHAHDVTDQFLAARQIQESEARFRTLITETPEVGVGLYYGKELRIQYVNDVMLAFWGKDASVIGKTFREALPELEGQPFFEQLDQVYKTGIPYVGREVKAELRSNEKLASFYFNYTYKALRNQNGEIYAIHHMAVDVTEQVQNKLALIKSEQSVRYSEARLRALLTASSEVIYRMSPDWKIMYHLGGRNFLAGTGTTENWQEKYIPVEDRQKFTDAINKAVTNKDTFQLEHRVFQADGAIGWAISRAIPILDADGNIIEWFGAATNITARKLYESSLEARVEDRTRELKRSNEDLQQFAHVASHDLKEPLRKIRIFTSLLEDEFRALFPDKAKSYIKKIISASDRLTSMVEGVLRFSEADDIGVNLEMISLNEVIAEIETDFEILIQQKSAVIKKDTLPEIEGAKVLVYQLFYNLINNSLKFSKPGISPVIQVSSSFIECNKREFAVITISDNGIGFEPEFQEKIFDTFLRLHSKDKYEGTGLGLSLCRKIVQRHGGTIKARGFKDQGAQFTVHLPLRQPSRK
jgi:PAS domain S-box-containing protein